VFHRHAWYVIGRSSFHGDVRPFKLGRFKSITRTGQAFHRPEGYALSDYLGNAWGIDPGKERCQVRLRFSPLVGPYVAEVNWHKTQRLSWDDDGRVLFSVTVDGLDEIAWWIHGFGAHVEVLEPPALRARVTEISAPAPESVTMGLCDI